MGPRGRLAQRIAALAENASPTWPSAWRRRPRRAGRRGQPLRGARCRRSSSR